MGKSVVLLLLFAAFLAVPRFSSAESTTINFNFKGLIPGGSCEPEPCEDCEECQQCEQCPEGPTEDLIALSTSLGLTTVYAAAEACGLLELFTNPNVSHTVFAPSNEAFDFLPDGFLDFLTDSPDLCASLLLGHVVGSVLPTTAMVDGMTVPPIVGEFDLTFDLTAGVSVSVGVSSATVISADHYATNGVIHVIDQLLASLTIPDAMPGANAALAGTADLIVIEELAVVASLTGSSLRHRGHAFRRPESNAPVTRNADELLGKHQRLRLTYQPVTLTK